MIFMIMVGGRPAIICRTISRLVTGVNKHIKLASQTVIINVNGKCIGTVALDVLRKFCYDMAVYGKTGFSACGEWQPVSSKDDLQRLLFNVELNRLYVGSDGKVKTNTNTCDNIFKNM